MYGAFFIAWRVCRRHRQAVLDAATSHNTLLPKCPSSTITLVEAGMSDTLLGNQARAGYGGDNERLTSASLVSLRNSA